MEYLNPETLPRSAAPLSGIAVVEPGSTLYFVSGQVAVDPASGAVVEGSVEAQVERVFANLGLALDAVGCAWDDVARFTVYLTDPAHLPAFHATRKRLFEEYFPAGVYPAATLLLVAGLARPELLVEIDAVAARV